MLAGLLPAPKNKYTSFANEDESKQEEPLIAPINSNVPPYPQRKGFLPIKATDFGDGGSFPEIHVVQYPLEMGRPGKRNLSLIPVQVNEKGRMHSELVVKQGTNQNKIVQSQMSDIKEKAKDEDKCALPDVDEEMATAEKTRNALEALIDSKISSSNPSTVVNPNEIPQPTFIRYNPNPTAPGYSQTAKQRVIKLVEAQVDPMEPPKHKLTKTPRGPPSPPVPVLHSPPRKITVADQQAWKVPPCISNWKNARGFIIPLDKRLAADGRGLQEVTINNKFAMLSEALFISERKAAEDLKIRNDIRKKMALREKEERETSLRDMANRARLERSGAIRAVEHHAGISRRGGSTEEKGDSSEGPGSISRRGESDDEEEEEDVDEFAGETEEEKVARQQREKLRLDRRKEREREMRLENMKGNMRRKKEDRDEGRDVSEKIALGMFRGSGAKLTGESLYDRRLFNQSAGMDAGFGAEDEYNTYSKPLFDRGAAGGNSIYRPQKNDSDIYGDADEELAKLKETSRFKPDKGFKGAEGGTGGQYQSRDAPVQFEKASAPPRRQEEEEDPFNIKEIVSERRESRRGESRERESRDRRRHDRDDDDRHSSRKRSRRDYD